VNGIFFLGSNKFVNFAGLTVCFLSFMLPDPIYVLKKIKKSERKMHKTRHFSSRCWDLDDLFSSLRFSILSAILQCSNFHIHFIETFNGVRHR
jgi:hypothetical protein